MEGLNELFLRAHELNLIKGVTFGDNAVHISHIQFADDTIIFLEPNMVYLLNSKRILMCFELASGLRINFHKSCVVRVGKHIRDVKAWARRFKCKKASLPITYLG
ncbi:hypothetical protein Dsin_005845 [Dipteronia sinensis]|uniref:Reverse transcriptase domain-containing protein n=1 Tax=Dipteronia sinensis TaxID=43782 RepID=A0AAE0EF05_9ROSI|nr:hypothetical protein Dsin_005845 [Dipteronia sinensis]